jgi:hypothetical protein
MAIQVQEFRGSEDALLYEIVKCPVTGHMTLLKLESFFEMWADDRVVDRRVLTNDEATRIESTIDIQWRHLIPDPIEAERSGR